MKVYVIFEDNACGCNAEIFDRIFFKRSDAEKYIKEQYCPNLFSFEEHEVIL